MSFLERLKEHPSLVFRSENISAEENIRNEKNTNPQHLRKTEIFSRINTTCIIGDVNYGVCEWRVVYNIINISAELKLTFIIVILCIDRGYFSSGNPGE